MGILSWLLLGLIVGALANVLARGRFPGGLLGTLAGGSIGAVLGGVLFSATAGRGIRGFDFVSILIALVGALLLLSVLRQLGRAEPRPVTRRRP
jgi:uncharacterized membrane protein YeaQ/YmgE (transglycosylase-associated protein family)